MDSSENYITFSITGARAMQIYTWRKGVSQEKRTQKTIEHVYVVQKKKTHRFLMTKLI